MTSKKVYKIVEGPSTKEIIEGLQFGHEGRLVSFTVEDDESGRLTFQAQILGLVIGRWEPGNNWFFKAIDEYRALGGEYIEGHVHTDYIEKNFVDGVLQLKDQDENQRLLDSIPDPINKVSDRAEHNAFKS